MLTAQKMMIGLCGIGALLGTSILSAQVLPFVPLQIEATLQATGIQSAALEPRPKPQGILGKIATDLRQQLATEPSPKSLHSGQIALASTKSVLDFYSRRDYQPAWISNEGKPQTIASELLAALLLAPAEGLRPAFYNSNLIKKDLRSLRIAFAPTPRQLADFDLLLTDAFLTYASHLLSGHLNPTKFDADIIIQPRSRDLAAVLQQALIKRDIKNSLLSLLPSHPGYARLRKALKRYREWEKNGPFPAVAEGGKFSLGATGERVQQLRARLRASGDLAATAAIEEQVFDADLDIAVKKYQARHGLKADGVVGRNTLAALNTPIWQRSQQLAINLERWRWMPEDLGQRHIIVNIPDYKMQLIENNQVVLDARAVVGRAERPTPILSASMSHAIVSPYWYVPPTIALEDKLPLLQRDPYSLEKQQIRVFSGKREIDPGEVDWLGVDENNFKYVLRQDPGPHNALGQIKFMFPNRHSIYIHDTPERNLFQRTSRAYSSGCIRIDNYQGLANYLFKDHPDWSTNTIAKQTKKRREQQLDLAQEIPVHVLYWTAWTDADGTVNFRHDIYQRDQPLAKALAL